jgi:iron complex transport system substrate-binding protein
MPDSLNHSLPKKLFTGRLAYVSVIGATLAIAAGSIELIHRLKAPADTVTALPASVDLSAQPFPRELRDAAGERLLIPAKPNRIVSQTLGTDEILVAICPTDRLVAMSHLAEDENYSNVVQEARSVPGRTTSGPEQILRMQPDLIFIASYTRAETSELLKASRAPVFRFAHFESINDIQSNIRAIGYATGCDVEAERLVHQMNQRLAAIRAGIPAGQAPPRVMSYGREGYTAGINTLLDDLLRAAGAVNVSAENGVTGFAKISTEKVAEWRADALVTGANRGEMNKVRKALLADPIVAVSPAGRAGRILVMDNRHFLSVSQHVVDAVEDLIAGLY